jgi:hypothetical protein
MTYTFHFPDKTTKTLEGETPDKSGTSCMSG